MKNIQFQFLFDILNLTPQMIFVKNIKHEWVYVNERLCEVVGVPQEGLLGKSDYDFFPKEEADVFWEMDNLVFETGQELVNEEYLTNASNGQRIILSTTKTLYVHESGEKYIIGIGKDITKIKEHEETIRRYNEQLEQMVSERTSELLQSHQELKRSEEKYRIFVENSNDGVIVLDEIGKIIIWNKKSYEITGVKYEEVVDNYYWDVFVNFLPYEERTQNRKDEIIAMIKNALSTGETFFGNVYEFEAYRIDNSVINIFQTAFSIRTEEGNKLCLIIQDITNQKHSEHQLYLSQEYYKTILHSIGDGVLVANREMNVTELNFIAQELTGWKDSEAKGKPIHEIFDIYDGSTLTPAINPVCQVIETGEPVKLANNTILKQKNGTDIQIADSAAPIRDRNGIVIGVVLVFRDVSKEYQNRQELIQSEKKYSTLISKMVQGVALHEIITDINGTPVDYRFLEINDSFEQLTGIKRNNVIGRTVREVIPGIEQVFIDRYGKVAIEGESVRFEEFAQGLNKYFEIIAYQPKPLQFATIFTDITENVNVRNKLKENESSLIRSQELARVGSWDYEIEKHKNRWSDNMFKILGYDPQSFKPTFEIFLNMVHPDDRNHVNSVTQNVITSGKNEYSEYRIISASGEIIWFACYITPILEAGNVIKIEGANIDITEQKKAKEREERLLSEYEIIFNATHDALFFIEVIDGQSFKYIRTNKVHQELTGLTPEMIDGKKPEDILDRTVSNIVNQNYCRCVQQAQIISYTEELALPAGKKIWETRLVPIIEKSKVKYIVGSSQDITENRKFLHEIKESEKTYRGLINSISEAVYVQDEFGTILDVNLAAEKLYGYSREELIGNTLELLSADKMNNIEEIEMKLKLAFQGNPQSFFFWAIAKDGNIFPKEVNLVSGTYYGKMVILAVGRNISERMRIEKELIMAKEKAEANDRLKTAFLNNISHEIRTPLNGILGFSDIICRMEPRDPKKPLYVKSLHASSDRLISTITDYVDVSLLVSGNIHVRFSDFLLEEFLQDIFNYFRGKFHEKELSFTFESLVEYTDVVIHSDKELLRKVFHHILDNALKFTVKGEVKFGYQIEPESIGFFVTDTGIGIAPDAIEFIFERFTHEDVSDSRGYEGSGLGLHISKLITELLGGSIWVESVKHQGSTFSFKIPFSQGYKVLSEKKSSIQKSEKNSIPVVLIAEDDLASYYYYKALLQTFAVKILYVQNGAEAVQLCKSNPEISLILMDVKMPVMNGLDATKIIKKLNPGIRIIAVTAYAMSGDEYTALESGCDDYLTKPVDASVFISKCQKYINLLNETSGN